MEGSDAAIIMVDLADQESINNTISWHRMFCFLFHDPSIIFESYYILGEIISSQQHSDKSKYLPIMIFSYKAYKDDAKYKIKPTEIS